MAVPTISANKVVLTRATAAAANFGSLPTGGADGDLLVVVISKENSAAVTAPSGWTSETVGDIAGTLGAPVLWRPWTGAASTNNFTWTGSVPRSAFMVLISGSDTSDPFDPTTNIAWTNSSGGSSLATGAASPATTPLSDVLMLVVAGNESAGSTNMTVSGTPTPTEHTDNGTSYLATYTAASGNPQAAKTVAGPGAFWLAWQGGVKAGAVAVKAPPPPNAFRIPHLIGR